jgi:hypothetical protein
MRSANVQNRNPDRMRQEKMGANLIGNFVLVLPLRFVYRRSLRSVSPIRFFSTSP